MQNQTGARFLVVYKKKHNLSDLTGIVVEEQDGLHSVGKILLTPMLKMQPNGLDWEQETGIQSFLREFGNEAN